MNSMTIKRAAIINMVAKYSVIIIQMVYNAILARILTPEDYGIVAVINVFVAFFTILADMGLGSAIVQRQDLDEDDFSSIFTFSILLAIILAVIFCIASIPISWFYKNDIYLNAGPILAVSVFFSTLNTVPNGLLMKKKKFVLVAVRQIIVNIVCSLIAIICAILGMRFYALLIYSVLTSFFTFMWNLHGSGVVLKLYWDRKALRKVQSFSSYLFIFNVMNYFSRNLDKLIIGKVMGTVQVGNYNKAYQLMLYPMNMLTNVITPVLHPILAEYQEDKEYIYSSFIKILKMLSIVGIYVSVFCLFASKEIVYILYGRQWENCISCLQILSLSIWAQMLNGTSGTMFQVLNRTDKQFIRGILTTTTTVLGIIVGIIFGSLESVSIGIVIAYNLNFLTMALFLVKGEFNKRVQSFVKVFLPDFMMGIVLSLTLYAVSCLQIHNIIFSFTIKLLISGTVYLVLLFITGEIKYLISLLPKKAAKKIREIFMKG